MVELKGHRGFTLIEVVVTIIVSAILAVLLMQVMRGHNYRSYWPLVKIDQDLALRQIMENITADHRSLLITDPQPLIALQGKITTGGYWSGQTYSSSIQIVDNRCLDDIRKDNALPSGEYRDPIKTDSCQHEDTLLKVTLAFDGEALTALFSR